MDLVLFDDEGDLVKVVHLGDRSSGGHLYFRFTQISYHTVRVTSDLVVFHETTNGPFRKEETIEAPWSPQEGDREAVRRFMDALSQRVERLASFKGASS